MKLRIPAYPDSVKDPDLNRYYTRMDGQLVTLSEPPDQLSPEALSTLQSALNCVNRPVGVSDTQENQ